jgi:hypothetical protein
MVRLAGLEPARVAPLPPQSSVSANSTISATYIKQKTYIIRRSPTALRTLGKRRPKLRGNEAPKTAINFPLPRTAFAVTSAAICRTVLTGLTISIKSIAASSSSNPPEPNPSASPRFDSEKLSISSTEHSGPLTSIDLPDRARSLSLT